MAKTYEPIATQTLTSSASSITFSNISNEYTDLVLVVSTLRAAGGFIHQMEFNGDSGSNYSSTVLNGGVSGSTALSTRYTNGTFMYASYGVQPTATIPDIVKINIMSYSNTNVNKTVLIEGAGIGGDSVERIVGLWRSANAINSIKFTPTGGASYAAGSKFSLYGIKAKSPAVPLLTESTKTTSSVSAIISNYDAGLTYTLATTAGTATRSGDTVTVSGLTQGQNVTLTVTATNGANSSSSNTISLTSEVPLAEGGTITTSGGYRIHTFTSSGTFTTYDTKNVEYLVVAGGGSGGIWAGSGGGAGGMRTGSLSLPSGSHPVVIGAGGAMANGGAPINSFSDTGFISGNNGNASSFYSISSVGGGKGGSHRYYGGTASTGSSGGSGGGGSYGMNSGGGYGGNGLGVGGPGTSGQGNSGGNAYTSSAAAAGGGGGAGSAGSNGAFGSPGGNGGSGLSSSISGAAVVYAGGGGGGRRSSGVGPVPLGGSGGGGNGAVPDPFPGGTNAVAGQANRGGGGGGGSSVNHYSTGGIGRNGAAGGSGIVILRYLS